MGDVTPLGDRLRGVRSVSTVGEPPETLPDDCAAKWRELVAGEWGLKLTAADRDLLERYCVNWVRWQRALAGVAEFGVLVGQTNGQPIASAWVVEADAAEARLHRIEQVVAKRATR